MTLVITLPVELERKLQEFAAAAGKDPRHLRERQWRKNFMARAALTKFWRRFVGRLCRVE